MLRKLLLSNTDFPNQFLSSNINIPPSISKQIYIENSIIDKLNTYNKKIKLSNIEYINLAQQFPHLNFMGKFLGLIVEEFQINESEQSLYSSNEEYYIFQDNNRFYIRKIIIYILMSLTSEGARNTFVSQTLFPEAIDLMEYYNESPCFSIANHPIYYVNIVDTLITAPMIIKNIAGMNILGIENINIFHEIPKLINIPKNMNDFLSKYYTDFVSASGVYTTNYCEINLHSKITKIKTTRLILGDLLEYNSTSSNYKFKGSEEKFYWMNIIPIIVISIKNSYTLDYSELEDFCNRNITNFRNNDDKFKRFLILIQFIKKIIKGSK